MKKVLKVTGALAAAALTLTACGSGASSDGASGAAKSNFKACLVSDSGGWDDHSFNESAYNGLQRAEKELGIQVDAAESKSVADFAPNIETLVSNGCNLTLGVGYLLAQDLTSSAQKNADLHFGIVDSSFQDKDNQPVELDNGRALVFNTGEAAYLAGYIAAGLTQTGTVGTLGGVQFPSVTIFMDGFADGIDAYNKAHNASVKLLGWDKASQKGTFINSFDDQALGKQQGQQLIDQGADILLPVAGKAGLGAAAAAKESGKTSVIGVDSDWYESAPDYKDITITSVMKRVDNAVFDTIKQDADGNFTNKAYIGTIENEGVGLAPFHDFDSKIPQGIKDEVKDLTDQMAAGTLTVESVSKPKA